MMNVINEKLDQANIQAAINLLINMVKYEQYSAGYSGGSFPSSCTPIVEAYRYLQGCSSAFSAVSIPYFYSSAVSIPNFCVTILDTVVIQFFSGCIPKGVSQMVGSSFRKKEEISQLVRSRFQMWIHLLIARTINLITVMSSFPWSELLILELMFIFLSQAAFHCFVKA